ncbi:MAG: endo-1,4-beta-xylanase [Clostridiales bacterium]|nr:endo-1,4-beta-xylanase [Clostridiales bacterium]
MKKKKIGALILALAMISSIGLYGCKKSESTTEGTSTSGTETTATSASETESTAAPVNVVKPEVKEGVPAVIEDFGGDATTYNGRGDSVTMELEDAAGADGKVLHIGGRTAEWNGVNFPIDAMIGNKISIQAATKSASGDVIISLQFDSMGSPSYSNVFHIGGCADSFVEGKGSINVPANCTNPMIYVESMTTDDIFVDYVYITVEGDYVDPTDIPELVLKDTSDYLSLKEIYKDDFEFGCCIPLGLVTSEVEEPRKLIVKEFSSFTCENEMKPENILDAETTLADPAKYNESPALKFDACKPILDFAKENGIKMRGHTLVWHSQTPDWFFYENYDINGKLASRELMLKRLENYIKGVFEFIDANYPDLFYAFDVANECVMDGSNDIRKSNWTETIGDDFLNFAFEYARKYANKNIKLFYNDYNEYVPGKQDKIIELMKPIKEAGNLDGIGMQSHVDSGVTAEAYITALKKYADELGVIIHITELDMKTAGLINPEYDQGLYYQALFEAILAAKKEGYKIESVTIWGLDDGRSWLTGENPVLFAGDLSTKLAFDGVVNAKKGGTIEKPADYKEPPKDSDPYVEDFEDGNYLGSSRAGGALSVVQEGAYEGNSCLKMSGASEVWDGYVIDGTRFLGKTIKYSFAVKSTAPSLSFSADITDLWPHLEEIDTSSGDWVFVEGVLKLNTSNWILNNGSAVTVPDGMAALKLYFETQDVTDDFYVDAIKIEVVG